MRLWTSLLRDESGFVLSSEMVLVGTLGVIGATVGLSAVADSVNEELKEISFAFRSLDQSFHVPGQSSGSAWTANSGYTQPSVEESRERLEKKIRDEEKRMEKEHKRQKNKDKEDKEERSSI